MNPCMVALCTVSHRQRLTSRLCLLKAFLYTMTLEHTSASCQFLQVLTWDSALKNPDPNSTELASLTEVSEQMICLRFPTPGGDTVWQTGVY